MTPEEVEANSQRRASHNTHRTRILFVLMFIFFSILAALLQRQQVQVRHLIEAQSSYTLRMCEQRRANTIKTNANWDGMAVIERHNKFIDDKIRSERIALYENAKLAIPECA